MVGEPSIPDGNPLDQGALVKPLHLKKNPDCGPKSGPRKLSSPKGVWYPACVTNIWQERKPKRPLPSFRVSASLIYHARQAVAWLSFPLFQLDENGRELSSEDQEVA